MTPFWMAWAMFWRIRTPILKWDKTKMKEMLLYLPVIGLFIGGIWCLLAYLAGRFMPDSIFVKALLSVYPIWITGFMHMDGFLDCADAVLSYRDREERLRILKDSHVGAFAVVMAGIYFILNFAAVADIDLASKWMGFAFIPAVSRACSAHCVLCMKPLETSSYEKMHQEGIGEMHKLISGLEIAVFTIAAVILCGNYGWASAVTAVSMFVVVFRINKNLGGMSGDISGSAITISELVGCVALALIK